LQRGGFETPALLPLRAPSTEVLRRLPVPGGAPVHHHAIATPDAGDKGHALPARSGRQGRSPKGRQRGAFAPVTFRPPH
jgi:hypothetical protein